jgi:hypothetical protein
VIQSSLQLPLETFFSPTNIYCVACKGEKVKISLVHAVEAHTVARG